MFGLFSLNSNAQTPLNGRFLITGVSDAPSSPGSNYSVEGTFTDPLYIRTADEILKGDFIADYEGKLFRIDKITKEAGGGSNITVDVTYLSGATADWNNYPALFQTGTLFRPTENGYPLVTYDAENANENLRISMQNIALANIDKDIRGFKSGTDAEIPATGKFGDLFYNKTEKKLYAYTENGWVPVGGGGISSGTSAEFPNPAKTGDMFFNKDEDNTYIYNGIGWLKISTNGSTPSGNANPDTQTIVTKAGDLFHNTSDRRLYVYNGSTWVPLDNVLKSGNIFVGNASDIAVSVTLSGDAEINNTGMLTIKPLAITDEKLNKSKIPLNGFANPTDNVSFGDGITNFKITNLANPSGASDAATKSYVDALMSASGNLTLANNSMFVGNATNKATAIAKNLIPISGFDKAGANVSMGSGVAGGNYKIINMADPAAAQDAATKNYVDTRQVNAGNLSLASGNFYVGSASNVATATAKTAIPLSGFGTPAGDVAFGNFKLTGLADPAADQDAATKKYVDTKTVAAANINLTTGSLFLGGADGKAAEILPSALPLNGFGAATSNIDLGGFLLNNLGLPLADGDAATKKYIDDLFKTPSTSLALPTGNLFVGNATGQARAVAKNTISISGFGKAAENVVMGDVTTQYGISFLADPIFAQDAATKNYVDTKTSAVESLTLATDHVLVGDASNKAEAVAKNTILLSDLGAAKADVAFGDGTTNFKLTNVADPVADQDAATKKYVDSKTTKTPAGPTAPTGAVAGDTYYNTTENRLYVYNGTAWVPLDNKLADGQLFIGDASGNAISTAKENITISGFGPAMADVDFGGFKLKNLIDPTLDQEAATKKYVDLGLETAAAAGKDNLGNHQAATNLKLGVYALSNDGTEGRGLTFNTAGDAFFAQNLTAHDVTVNGNFAIPSDERLKTNIKTLTTVLQNLEQMRGVVYEYKDQHKYAAGPKIGVIAQELRKVYPEMVVMGADGFFKVDYTQLTGVLIQAVKEQQQQIETLKTLMVKQQEQVNRQEEQMKLQQEQINSILKKIQ